MISTINIGASGILGWKILQRTETRHMEILAKDPQINRATRYFHDNIEKTQTARDLVDNYRMLNVALNAFGLEADIGNKAFIRKVLESDLSDKNALANRLGDKRYLRFAEAFGYGPSDTPKPLDTNLKNNISQLYLDREFEKRIGEADENLRLALNARRELHSIRNHNVSDKALWYEILGNPALRTVFQTAFGFNENYTKLPIDRQHSEYINKSKKILGGSSSLDISKPEVIEKIIKGFLAKNSVTSNQSYNKFRTALTLLS